MLGGGEPLGPLHGSVPDWYQYENGKYLQKLCNAVCRYIKYQRLHKHKNACPLTYYIERENCKKGSISRHCSRTSLLERNISNSILKCQHIFSYIMLCLYIILLCIVEWTTLVIQNDPVSTYPTYEYVLFVHWRAAKLLLEDSHLCTITNLQDWFFSEEV